MSRSRGKRLALLLLCFVGVVVFAGLGVWQLERRIWKLDLIQRVEARVHAVPEPVPPSSTWATLNPRDVEYRHVRLSGEFQHDRETFVEALTERGSGFWVLTPLRTKEGTILVNRGFVPPDAKTSRLPAASGEITGLLRLTEPGGRFLRENRPAEDRWFSRDVEAIARKRGIGPVAPFFIDADAQTDPARLPIGGLTVVSFRNMHLVYALTWFALAGMCAMGAALVLKRGSDVREGSGAA